ncbi:MAG: hypothetical protein HC802_10830, partial [Caldilineaceae bacterium]|nr:hypothetical protein [Caldilineaceae bacterium]
QNDTVRVSWYSEAHGPWSLLIAPLKIMASVIGAISVESPRLDAFLSSDETLLNTFAYTGAFTCYAIDGGAQSTTTVDLSKTYCDWARRNLLHNGISEGAQHRVLQQDCLPFLEEEARNRARYDLIVCDPPTFSASKRMAQNSFAVNRDHAALIGQCIQILTIDGVLYFSTNSRRFQLAENELPSNLTIEEISQRTVPEDFRNSRIHRCWRLTRTH